ncbi:MAG: DUF4136 domain-containing protein [Flammeovirgaceae bacterium]|nr:DUF4136 domain-containing protein [Flammeovirgaceae bacterium]
MKNLLILFVLLSMAACSSIQVSYDYDKSADFTKYKTYDYTEETKSLGGSSGQLIKQRLLSSVDQGNDLQRVYKIGRRCRSAR